MKSEFCKQKKCPFFGNFNGKPICRAQVPKIIKHLDKCPQTL